jgi:hypothetical protein
MDDNPRPAPMTEDEFAALMQKVAGSDQSQTALTEMATMFVSFYQELLAVKMPVGLAEQLVMGMQHELMENFRREKGW